MEELSQYSSIENLFGVVVFLGVVWAVYSKNKTGKWPWSK